MAPDDGDEDVLLLVHQVPVDMEEGRAPRLAHLLPPLHHAPPPHPPPPFRSPPPPPQAAASAEHRISFRGWLGIPRHWDDWVAKLRPRHGRLWRHLGIHDAVLASTLRFKRDAPAILHLASFWSPATSSFAFPWGEATVTLQDVALLAGFPVLGAPAPAPLPPQWRPDEAALNGVRLGFNRSACKKAHHSAWVKHFLTDDTADPVFEHAAFLALWLTRFVLPGHPESTMRQSVFPIAVRLARGERVALAPAVLASLYRDLREIKAFLIAAGAAATTDDADTLSSISVYSPLYIIQLWMWERFPALRPAKVNPLVDGDPLAARWHDLSRKLNPAQIRQALNTGFNFVWQPYVCSTEHTGWVRSSDLTRNDELKSLAHFLHPCELVGMDGICIEQYLPHRVARQFGLDQDVPGDFHRADKDWAIAWQTYQLEGKNVAFFIPHSEPGVTARYAQWWRQQLPPSHIDAAAASAPVVWKPSKRKVKKTPAAMEAEAEKERRTKKARVSPTTDKKRKLEELYDTKLSDWLPTTRNEISDTTSDMGSEEALLPNVGTTNDDIVLLMPKKQTTTAPVMALMDNSMTPSLGERGNFMVDEPPDIPSVPEAGVPATQEEEIVKIPVVISLDVPDKPEGGATALMEEQKEANSVSDRSEEASAQVIEEVEEKVAIEGAICATGMNPSGNNTAVLTEADGRKAVPKEFGRAAEEAREAVPQSQHEVDAGVTNNSHDAVALPEEALPVQPTNNYGGCHVVSHTIEDSKVAGDSDKNDHEIFCDFVEEQREIPCVEEIARENSQMGKEEREEISHESPQVEIVECVQDIVLMETGCDVEQKIVHTALEDVATSNSMGAALLGVPEPENAELNKDPEIANKDVVDIPMEVAQGEEAELEQIRTSAKGGAEEHEEFSEVDHMGTADANSLLHLNSEVSEKIDEIERTEVDGTMKLTGRDSDKKLGDVPEAGYKEDENIRGLAVNTSDRKPSEVSQAEPAKLEDSKDLMNEDTDKSENVPGLECTGLEETHGDLMKEGTNNKTENVPELENTGLGGNCGPIEDTDGRLKEIHDVNAELEKYNVHQSNIDRSEDIMQIDPLTQDEARWLAKEGTEDNTTKVQEVKYEQLRNEALVQEDTKEKPCADSKDLSENVVDQSKEVDELKQAEGEGCQVLMEKDVENISDAFVLEQTEDGHRKSLIETNTNNHSEITLVEQLDGQSERLTRTGTEEIHGETIKSQEMEFYKDVAENSNDSTNDKEVVEDSNNSVNAEMPCSSATVQLKEDKMEVFDEVKIEEPSVQDVELINQREPSSDATAMEIEAVALEQDNRIICKNMEATRVEGSHMLDSGLNSDLAKVDETHAAQEIKNQEFFDVDMQVAMDERQDVQVVTGNDKRNMSEDTGMSVCSEYQINSTGTEDVKSTKGLQNQECLDQTEQLAREERHNLGTTTENNKMNMLEDADLVCEQYQNGPTHTKVNRVKPTKGMQNQELLNNKEDQVMEERVECEVTDRSGVFYEESCKLDGGRVNTSGVAVDVGDSVLNKEACNTEELQAMEDKQHDGIGHANEKRILEDTSMIDTAELKSDSPVMEVSMPGLSEGTLNQCALSLEKEEALQGKHDQGVVDENTNRGSVDIDALECGGVNPDEAMNIFHETALTTEAVNIAGSKILSENKQKEAPFEESNESARKEPEALPQEPGNLVKIKQESLENGTEMSIFSENDKVSGKHQTSADFLIGPSNMDERGEDDVGWPDESAKGCERLTSDSINTVHSIKFVKSSNEEVKRTQNTRSMYLKDIKESLGRIRAEPSNRVHTTSVGYNSRHTVQDPISSCKEIKVPLRDSARDFGRERALELVVTSPQEETPRWRQEQYALQILEDVQNSRIAEKSRMEMELRVLKAQVSSMERQVMNLDHFSEVKSRSSLNQQCYNCTNHPSKIVDLKFVK